MSLPRPATPTPLSSPAHRRESAPRSPAGMSRQGLPPTVLVARRADRLRDLADRLAREHAVTAEVLALDLADAEARAGLVARIGGTAGLVNCAGFGTNGLFQSLDPARARTGDRQRAGLAALTRGATRNRPGIGRSSTSVRWPAAGPRQRNRLLRDQAFVQIFSGRCTRATGRVSCTVLCRGRCRPIGAGGRRGSWEPWRCRPARWPTPESQRCSTGKRR